MNLNATLVAQLVVFFVLAWFTMKFVWPPIMKALDERAQKIAEGLAAADKAKTDMVMAERRAAEEMGKAKDVAPLQRGRNGARLDRGGFGNAAARERLHKFRVQPEHREISHYVPVCAGPGPSGTIDPRQRRIRMPIGREAL